MERRTLLKTAGAGSLIMIAGCSGGGDNVVVDEALP